MADVSERAVSITNALSAQTASVQADFPGSVTSQRNLLKRGNVSPAWSILWGVAFGNGGLAGDTNTLFFASGLNDEADGLFGSSEPD